MKKMIILPVMFLLCFIISTAAFGQIEVSNETKYGRSVAFSESSDYPGVISIDGLFVYRDKEDLVFTLLYSSGKLATVDNKGKKTVKTSFFDPPSGLIIKISWLDGLNQISSDDKKVQYRVNAEKFKQAESITVFLYDVLYENNEQNISLYFKTKAIDFDKLPSAADLVNGYEFEPNYVAADLDGSPSSWAHKQIEELKISGGLREAAFESYKEGITRLRFAYLMVKLYELLTGHPTGMDNTVSFKDTADPYALKAAHIGITAGIGGGRFGPDIILNREQMTTQVVKTLQLANVDLGSGTSPYTYSDDAEISPWAKDAVYLSRQSDIIGGTGGNMFSPGQKATNEQALTVVHKLMNRYGHLKWYDETDGSRFYLKFNGELYNLGFEKNVILGRILAESDIFLSSYKDVNTLVYLAKGIDFILFEPTQNPNFKGTVKVNESDLMKVSASNIYYGVDKIGEKTIVIIKSEDGEKQVTASVNQYIKPEAVYYSGFDRVDYYDLNGERKEIYVLPIRRIFETLGIKYTIGYNSSWDIYIIEFAR